MLSDLKVIPPKKDAFTIETDEHFPKLHTLTCWSGKRGSGKSVACASQIAIAKKRGYYDRCWLICGTFESNREIWQNIAGIDDDDVILPTKHAFAQVIVKLEEEKKQWDTYLSQMKAYKQFNKTEKGETNFFKHLTTRNSLDLSKPKWPYKKAVPPRCCVVLDDCMGEDLMVLPSAKLTRYLIAHRHWAGGLGISVHMLLQSYSSRESLPRPVREQLTVLCLFAMSQIEQIKKVWSEADLPGLSFEAFLSMFRTATAERHSFITIDFSPKEEYKRYRICMDQYLDPTPFIFRFPMKE
tara:strand:+ start:102 stop:992 length:891 start_codon:yes stop_codon:yes gene_type:complete